MTIACLRRQTGWCAPPANRTKRDSFCKLSRGGIELSDIDAWRDRHTVPTRPEAIRRLVELGLAVKMSAQQLSSIDDYSRSRERITHQDDRELRHRPKSEPSAVDT
jgi:hypothetical protein